jgi:hypothetical protein
VRLPQGIDDDVGGGGDDLLGMCARAIGKSAEQCDRRVGRLFDQVAAHLTSISEIGLTRQEARTITRLIESPSGSSPAAITSGSAPA